jgi:hypothetical protein
LFAVLGLVLALLLVRGAMQMADPERQWAKLGEVVAVDERPAGWRIQGLTGFLFFVPDFHGAWVLESADGSRNAMFLAFEAGARSDFDAMFTGDVPASVPFAGMGAYDPEPGVLEVQGRELRVLRFRTERPDGEPGVDGRDAAGAPEEPSWLERVMTETAGQLARAAVNVDVTSDPVAGPLVLVQYSTPRKLERIADEELALFLDHFDLETR